MARAGLKSLFGRLATVWRSKDRRYWLTAAVVLAVTLYATPWVNKQLGLNSVRYKMFQATGALTGRPLRARYTKIVAITNDDYIKGSGGISPVNRAYLARIVTALNGAHVPIIALDFILHFADQRQTPVHVGDYSSVGNVKEVDALVSAIIAAADDDTKIILPIDIRPVKGTDSYLVVPAIYQAYGICTKLVADGVWDSSGAPGFKLSPKARKNINCGYIELPIDPRQIPPLIDLHQKWRIASLSLAIAAARDPQAAETVGSSTKFTTSLPPSNREPVSAGKLIQGDQAVLDALRPSAVIVGGMWNAHDKPEPVDQHPGLTGNISGVLMHENFTEGILDGRLVTPLPDWVRFAIEAILGIGFAFAFAAFSQFWAKLVLLAGIAAGLLLVQWLLFALLASFLDAFLPLLSLALHSILEKLLE